MGTLSASWRGFTYMWYLGFGYIISVLNAVKALSSVSLGLDVFVVFY